MSIFLLYLFFDIDIFYVFSMYASFFFNKKKRDLFSKRKNAQNHLIATFTYVDLEHILQVVSLNSYYGVAYFAKFYSRKK